MQKEIQVYELELVEDLVQAAFENAATAFSKFINRKVSAQSILIGSTDQMAMAKDDPNDKMYILISQLRGDLKGKCYLNFSSDDAEEFFRMCLAPEYAKDNSMSMAMLMELDNILTAAVVSIIAARLNINTYAYVPHLVRATRLELSRSITDDHEIEDLVLHFKTIFKIDKFNLSTEFIWIVEKKLIDILMDIKENNTL